MELDKFNKTDLINQIRFDKSFRDELISALTDKNNVSLNDKCDKDMDLSHYRNSDKEDDLVAELIDNFDFGLMRKLIMVLPALDEELAFLSDIDGYSSVEKMKETAERDIRRALDGMFYGRYMETDADGNRELNFYYGAQFEIQLYYDIDRKEYSGKLSYDLLSWTTW